MAAELESLFDYLKHPDRGELQSMVECSLDEDLFRGAGVKGLQREVYDELQQKKAISILGFLAIGSQERAGFISTSSNHAGAWLAASPAVPYHRMADGDFAASALASPCVTLHWSVSWYAAHATGQVRGACFRLPQRPIRRPRWRPGFC